MRVSVFLASVVVAFILGVGVTLGVLGPEAVPSALGGLSRSLNAVSADAVATGFVALIGVAIGSYLTDLFSERRSASTERSLRQQDLERRRREDDLEILDQTRRSTNANLNRMVAHVGGDATGAGTIPVGTHVYPRSDPNLIDDVQLVRDYAVVAADLMGRRPGTLTARDVEQTSAIQVRLKQVFDRQQERIAGGQPMVRVDPDIVARDPVLSAVYGGLVGPARAEDA